MDLSLGRLMIFVPDLEQAKVFYRDVLGLALQSETDRRVTFLVGAVPLDAFRCDHPGRIGDYANEARSVFVFRVAEIDAAFAELTAKGVNVLHAAPVQANGVRYAAFADPFGNVHEIAQFE